MYTPECLRVTPPQGLFPLPTPLCTTLFCSSVVRLLALLTIDVRDGQVMVVVVGNAGYTVVDGDRVTAVKAHDVAVHHIGREPNCGRLGPHWLSVPPKHRLDL